MATLPLMIGLLAYVLAGRGVMRCLTGPVRETALAALNVAGVFWFLFYGDTQHYLLRFGIYLALIVGLYLLVCLFADKRGNWPWLAFFAPIVALIIVRYVPAGAFEVLGNALGRSWHGVPNLIGISYLAFRCSRLVLEIRNGVVQKPNFLEYLNFAFFLPTMPVGPINTYANFRRGFAETYDVPVSRAALRILVGAVKYQFLASLCSRLDYAGLLLDDHPHQWLDLPVAMVFYYLYLYLNFSGFCDMAIGAAALIGIPVPENFANPFAARNVKDFWNRWHITLSGWMRDVVFSPLSKFLVHVMGIKLADHAIALTIAVVFLLVGIWHGVGWHYAAFGAMHALGVVTNHYYTLFLKKKLGRERFKAYNENPGIRAVAVTLTFGYCAASLFLFANTFTEMKEVFAVLR
jgi:D-alanyl-lipoteichoic acid acyltransferase DltB (MBOAT superfamily)